MDDVTSVKKISKKMLALNPFVDKDGLVRVGGRIKNAHVPYAQQHPILLPQSNVITDLIIRDYHLSNHHAGIQTTLYLVRQKF